MQCRDRKRKVSAYGRFEEEGDERYVRTLLLNSKLGLEGLWSDFGRGRSVKNPSRF